MQPRHIVPFDLFSMREDVRVSSLVRVGEQGWTCGQCPLDTHAHVIAPHDLTAQAASVCSMISTVLERGGFSPHHAAQLILYHAAPSAHALTDALNIFRQAFPHGPAILPVAVPYFYYEGMLLEVDVFADQTVVPSENAIPEGVQVLDGETFSYLTVQGREPSAIDAAYEALGLSPNAILQEVRFGPATLRAGELEPSSPSLVQSITTCAAAFGPDLYQAALIVSRNEPVRAERTHDGTMIREAADTVVLLSLPGRAQDDLVTQTRAAMHSLDQALTAKGLDWSHVVKISAPYVGDASAGALHENLRVRHSFHAHPYPASTGLPVLGFATAGSRISLDVVARR